MINATIKVLNPYYESYETIVMHVSLCTDVVIELENDLSFNLTA